jgi:hypothetical protein
VIETVPELDLTDSDLDENILSPAQSERVLSAQLSEWLCVLK